MTRGIDDFLGIPRLEDALRESGDHPFDDDEIENDDISEDAKQFIGNLEGIMEGAMETQGTDHEEAMDKIYEETLKHANDLVDMAYNIDLPRARGMFEQANNFYAKAIDAKNSKRDAQLKMFRLMLDKRKLDMAEQRLTGEPVSDGSSNSSDTVLIEDRNTLIERILKARDEKKD